MIPSKSEIGDKWIIRGQGEFQSQVCDLSRKVFGDRALAKAARPGFRQALPKLRRHAATSLRIGKPAARLAGAGEKALRAAAEGESLDADIAERQRLPIDLKL